MTDYARRSWSADRVAKDRIVSEILYACSQMDTQFDWVQVEGFGGRPDRAQLSQLDLGDLQQLLRNLEILVGPGVLRGYVERDLQGFERRSSEEPIMYHDARDIWERSG